jgi:hypothetical protein
MPLAIHWGSSFVLYGFMLRDNFLLCGSIWARSASLPRKTMHSGCRISKITLVARLNIINALAHGRLCFVATQPNVDHTYCCLIMPAIGAGSRHHDENVRPPFPPLAAPVVVRYPIPTHAKTIC